MIHEFKIKDANILWLCPFPLKMNMIDGAFLKAINTEEMDESFTLWTSRTQALLVFMSIIITNTTAHFYTYHYY